jgi:hypothetical protein
LKERKNEREREGSEGKRGRVGCSGMDPYRQVAKVTANTSGPDGAAATGVLPPRRAISCCILTTEMYKKIEKQIKAK